MKSQRRGATLPELMIVMSVMGVLLMVAARMVKFGYEFYRYTDESITLQREGLLALSQLSRDLTESHQRSIVVNTITVSDPEPDPHHEDQLIIPLPQNLEGLTEVNKEGAAKWMAVVGYEIDTTRPSRPLIRYLGDTQHDPGNDFWLPAPDNTYTSDIETVLETEMTTVDELKAFPATGLRTRAVARHLLEFKATRAVDTIDVEITIFLKGIEQGTNSLDNSLSLRTTVFPRN